MIETLMAIDSWKNKGIAGNYEEKNMEIDKYQHERYIWSMAYPKQNQ